MQGTQRKSWKGRPELGSVRTKAYHTRSSPGRPLPARPTDRRAGGTRGAATQAEVEAQDSSRRPRPTSGFVPRGPVPTRQARESSSSSSHSPQRPVREGVTISAEPLRARTYTHICIFKGSPGKVSLSAQASKMVLEEKGTKTNQGAI